MLWIFFDCFNTLVDEADRDKGEHGMGPLAHLPVEAGLYASNAEFIDAYLAWRRGAFKDGTNREIPLVARLREMFGPGHDTLISAMDEAFEPAFVKTLSITPGIVDVLEHCKTRYQLAVVSNIFVPGLPHRVLKRFGLRDYFEFIVDSAELGYKKPAPQIYASALDQAQVAPGEVLFVGDSLRNDVEAPAEEGMRSAWFNRSNTSAPSGIVEFDDWSNFRSAILENMGD